MKNTSVHGTGRILTLAWLVFAVTASAASAGAGTIEGTVSYKSPRWIRDTVVYLEHAPGDWKSEDATVDQKGSTFVPKFLSVIAGSTVTFKNSDPTDHNVYSPDGETYDLGVKGQGETLSHKFEEIGVYTQLCKLHPTMIGYVIVLQNPFSALSDKDGKFKIEGVPAGHYKLVTWNERFKADVVEVDVKGGGTASVTVELHR